MRKNDIRFNRPKARKVSGKKQRFATPVRAMKMKVKKGDTVKVISGKDKGKEGVVMRAFPKTGHVVIEGIAVVKRSLRKSARGQSGRIIERPMPIDASNVMLTGKAAKKAKTTKADKKDETETSA